MALPPKKLTIAIEGQSVTLSGQHAELRQALDLSERLITGVLPTSTSHLPEVDFAKFLLYYDECVKIFSIDEATRLAREDAANVVIPVTEDLERILELGSISDYIRTLHELNNPNMFNVDRYEDLFASIPDSELSAADKAVIKQIAEVGSPYCVPPDFTVFCAIQELRRRTVELGNCHIKHAIKLHSEGKALLLKISDLPPGFLERFNVDGRAMAHWTVKFAADGSLHPPGRFLLDMNTDPSGASQSLNSDAAKEASRKYYGAVSYPSIIDFITDVKHYCDENKYDLKDIRFFVEDNKGAFNCHKKDPTHCANLCVRVSVNHLMIPIYGMFGHHAEPFAWELPARALDIRIREAFHGVFGRFVDDRYCGVHVDFAEADRQSLIDLNVRCYGTNALDTKKSQLVDTVMVAIGFHLSSATGMIRPNEKAIRKINLAFFSVSIRPRATWSLQEIQMLGSLAERYSQVLVGMRAFVQPFHDMSANCADHIDNPRWSSYKRKPSSQAKFALLMWRAVGLTLFANPDALSVPMFSLVKDATAIPHYRPITDAFQSIGMIIRDSAYTMVSWSSFVLPFEDTMNRQNAKEFMGIICALLSLYLFERAPSGSTIEWSGDNMSALSWVEDNKARSAFAQYAFTAYSWLIVRTGYFVVSTRHVAGNSSEMARPDAMSRNSVHPDEDASLHRDLGAFPPVVRLFALLNPNQVHPLYVETLVVFEEITSCITQILALR